MSELQIIEATLQRAARRRRWARALRGLWVGLLAGSAVWLVTLGVYKLWPIPLSSFLWAGGVALAGPLFGILIGGWRKPALAETARWVDVKQNLKERLSTALEVAAQPNGSTWEQLVVSDAGIGIDPTFVPMVFEPFRQADASRSRAHGGLGLGLSIVRRIAELQP